MEGKGTRLKKRGGIYYIVRQGNSRGRSTGTSDRGAAERALAVYIQGKDRADAVKGVGLTVNQAFTDYLEEYARPNRLASLAMVEIDARYFALHFPVDKLIVDIVDADIDDPKGGMGYIQRRRAAEFILKNQKPRPAQNGTIRRELGVLVAVFGHAVKKKRISKMALPTITPPPPPRPKDRWLTAAEEDALIAACPCPEEGQGRLTRIFRFVMLAADTAARKEALTSLTWFQVDFEANTIALNPADRLQTKKRRSVVPMSRRLRAILERAYREKTSGYVLDHPGKMRKSFESAVARARLVNVTPHTLRHTWATRAARAGVSLIDIADMLGDDVQTVEKNYRHQSPAHLKGAADWRDREVGIPTTDQKEEKA